MGKYKLVIFDLDGTLADTSPGIFNSIRYTQKKMNLPEISTEQMRTHIGPPIEESYNRNFGLTGDKLKKAAFYHKEYAMNAGYKELILYNGIKDLLIDLKNANIKIAIATLKPQSTAFKIFEHLGIFDLFDIIIGAQIDNPRTKSQMINYCIESLGMTKQDSVLIGDSDYDAIGAQEASVGFIAVTYGFGFTDALSIKYPCIGVVNATSDIYKFIFK